MSRKFYVTLTQAVKEYTRSSTFEEVYADEVMVNECGALVFLMEYGAVAVVYAPGTWVLFTEDKAK
jgi:hypothetical protein